jgi:hypothetical protein
MEPVTAPGSTGLADIGDDQDRLLSAARNRAWPPGEPAHDDSEAPFERRMAK